MVGAKSFHKVLNNEERSLVGYWASSALQGPQLSPCCNRVVRKGTQISETLSPCPSDLCKSNRVWRKLLWPHWSPGDTHLMFWNQQSGYKLPQRHRDLGRLWPQSHRVTSGLSRQVCAPCPAPPPTRGCHPASRLSLPRPELQACAKCWSDRDKSGDSAQHLRAHSLLGEAGQASGRCGEVML